MFGRPAESNGFAKYSRNPSGSGSLSGLGQISTGVNNLFSSGSFGVQTSGSVFGGSAGGMNGEAKQVMHFKNVNSTGHNVFGKASSGTYSGLSPSLMFGAGGLGNSGSSASVVGVNQPVSFMPLKGSSMFTFGRTDSDVDAARDPAFRSSSSSFGGSSGSKSPVGDFKSVSCLTSDTSGKKSLPPEKRSFFSSDPVIPTGSSGGTFTFGSNLTPFGITSTSNVPAFGNTGNAVAPHDLVASGSSGGAFSFGSKLTPFGIANTSNLLAFGNTGNTVAPDDPVIASGSSGSTFTFGSKLTPFGITNTSNVPALGNTGSTVAPASGLPFYGASRPPSSYVSCSTASRSGLGFGSGSNIPSGIWQGGGRKTKPYNPTAMVDDAGRKTAEKLQSISAMADYQNKSHEELVWEDFRNRGGSWADSAVQPNEKIGSNAYVSLPTGSNMPCTIQPFPLFSTEKLDFTPPIGTVTGPCPTFTTRPSATLPEVTFESRANSPIDRTASRSTVWWAMPQPARASIPTAHVPAVPSPIGQSPPSFSCFFKHAKPAHETEAVLGLTFSNGVLDGASISSQPDCNQMYGSVWAFSISSTTSSPVSSIGDVQPSIVVANPFRTYRETKPTLLHHSESASFVQLGISSMPVVSKPTPVKTSNLLTCRHLSRRRNNLSARKPPPINDGPKVPFFSSHDEIPRPRKGHSWIIARDNPKAWMTNPTQLLSPTNNADTMSPVNLEGTSRISPDDIYDRGAKDDKTLSAGLVMSKIPSEKLQANDYSNTTTIISQASKEHGTLQLPKLHLSDYYTEPSMEELAANEKAEPGFLSHVKDFMVGRHGYGHIKFNGETDVRQLDINSILKFNHREVSVYMEESTKPRIGQGLNKPAEITLLNIKAVNKRTGREYTDGEKAYKLKEMLIQKANDNGAEFISYDPFAGEWKFSVPHFGW